MVKLRWVTSSYKEHYDPKNIELSSDKHDPLYRSLKIKEPITCITYKRLTIDAGDNTDLLQITSGTITPPNTIKANEKLSIEIIGLLKSKVKDGQFTVDVAVNGTPLFNGLKFDLCQVMGASLHFLFLAVIIGQYQRRKKECLSSVHLSRCLY